MSNRTVSVEFNYHGLLVTAEVYVEDAEELVEFLGDKLRCAAEEEATRG